MSISFISGQLGLGGAERQLYLLSKGLVERGWRVSVINLNPSMNAWEGALTQAGIRVYSVPRNLKHILRLPQIIQIILNERPQILHSWTLYANLYAALVGLIAGVPVKLGAERSSPKLVMQRIGRLKYRLSLIGIDGCLVNSEIAREQLQTIRPGLRVFYVKNGVEVSDLDIQSRESLKQKYHIPKSKIVIGTLGSLMPYKNVASLIQVFSNLTQDHQDLFLVVAGDGELFEDLRDEAAALLGEYNHCFLGAVENGNHLVGLFDIFCLPSLCEGMPNVVMEASAAQVPVVATGVGAVPELIENHVSGFIVQPGDTVGMTAALSALISNPGLRIEMGRNAKAKMLSDFGVNQMVDAVEKIYVDSLST